MVNHDGINVVDGHEMDIPGLIGEVEESFEESPDARLEVSCTLREGADITIENVGKHYLFGQLYEKVSTHGLLQLSIKEAEELSKKLAVIAKDARRLEKAYNRGECTSIDDFKL